MTAPAVITIRRDTDINAARLEAEAAVEAGRAANVFTLAGGCRTLVVRAVPKGDAVLLQTIGSSSEIKHEALTRALRREFGRVPDLLDARPFDGAR